MKKNEFDIFEGMKIQDEDTKFFSRVNSLSEIIFKIIKKRVELNMSQRELAARTGIKQPMIARIESLKTIPRLDTLINIVTELGMTLLPVDNFDEMIPIDINIKIEITMKDQTNSLFFNSNNSYEKYNLGGTYGI